MLGAFICNMLTCVLQHCNEMNENYIESPSTNSGAVPLPTVEQKRWSGIRYLLVHIGHLFGMTSRRTEANDCIFFSKQSEPVQVPLLPLVPDFPNGDRKGKRRAERPKLSSASCPLMDSDSQMSSTLSDVLVEMCERENVYNPLTRETDPEPYDHLILRKPGSGARITYEGAPGSPHDYFELEKEKNENPQHGDKKSRLYFILEKDEDSLDKDYSSNPTELEGVDESDCNTKSDTIHSIRPEEKCENENDHGYFVLESTASSTDFNHGKGSNTLVENSSGQTLGKSSSQHHMNTESSLASYETAKNSLSLDDNQNHSIAKSSSTQSYPSFHKTPSTIHESNNTSNNTLIESTEHSVNNYEAEASKGIAFAEDSTIGDHYIDQKDLNVCGSNVGTAKQNTTSDECMEPIKSRTL